MAKYKVKTPNENFSGERLGVQFYRGEAEVELNDIQKSQFEDWGYTVEEIKEKKEAPKKKSASKKSVSKEEK